MSNFSSYVIKTACTLTLAFGLSGNAEAATPPQTEPTPTPQQTVPPGTPKPEPKVIDVQCPITFVGITCDGTEPKANVAVCIDTPLGLNTAINEFDMSIPDLDDNLRKLNASPDYPPEEKQIGTDQMNKAKIAIEQARKNNACTPK